MFFTIGGAVIAGNSVRKTKLSFKSIFTLSFQVALSVVLQDCIVVFKKHAIYRNQSEPPRMFSSQKASTPNDSLYFFRSEFSIILAVKVPQQVQHSDQSVRLLIFTGSS